MGTIRINALLQVSSDCESASLLSAITIGCYTTGMTHDITHAHPDKARVAAISIFARASMGAAKLVVGIIIGSPALISEALPSSVDLVATIIPWLVVKVSDQPAD